MHLQLVMSYRVVGVWTWQVAIHCCKKAVLHSYMFGTAGVLLYVQTTVQRAQRPVRLRSISLRLQCQYCSSVSELWGELSLPTPTLPAYSRREEFIFSHAIPRYWRIRLALGCALLLKKQLCTARCLVLSGQYRCKAMTALPKARLRYSSIGIAVAAKYYMHSIRNWSS